MIKWFVNKESNIILDTSYAKNFIPIICHYNKNTLIAKDGSLIQTIKINSLNSRIIKDNLNNMRNIILKSITSIIDIGQYGLWIHTIRQRYNINNIRNINAYDNKFIADTINNKWNDLLELDSTFINVLYISIVHYPFSLKINNIQSLINSFFSRVIKSSEQKFLSIACSNLTKTVDKIINDLNSYDIEKLGIYTKDNIYYSRNIELYKLITQCSGSQCPLPRADISSSLSNFHFHIKENELRITNNKQEKKYISILSLKEFSTKTKVIDRLMQLPINLIITEILYVTDSKKAILPYKYQNYITKLSKDEEIISTKELNKILDINNKAITNTFFNQQISFMVIANSNQELEDNSKTLSQELSNIGLIHVLEDINLEKIFWSQLPSNFSFITKPLPKIIDNLAIFTTLNYWPIGNQYNPWGEAITIMKTENQTNYFFSFHDKKANNNLAIFGIKDSGKTSLVNFFIAQSMKFNPTIIHISNDLDSGIFAKVNKAKWFQMIKELFNPLLVDNSKESEEYLFEFFKIISKHYFDPLTEQQLLILKKVVKDILSTNLENRVLSKIIENINEAENQNSLKNRLSLYSTNGKYYKVFEKNKILTINDSDFIAYSLISFDNNDFLNQKNINEYGKIAQIEYELNTINSLKAGIIFAMQYLLSNTESLNPKLLVLDNIDKILDLNYYSYIINIATKNLKKINGVLIFTVNIEALDLAYQNNLDLTFLKNISSNIFLPTNITTKNTANILNLNKKELTKILSLNIFNRMFLLKQDNNSIVLNFNINKWHSIKKILKSTEEERKLYNQIVSQENKENKDDWINLFYSKL